MEQPFEILHKQLDSSTSPEEIRQIIFKLTQLSQTDSESEDLWLLLGHAHRKLQDWKEALNSYTGALRINPDSAARGAYEQVMEILNFFNKDLFNQ